MQQRYGFSNSSGTLKSSNLFTHVFGFQFNSDMCAMNEDAHKFIFPYDFSRDSISTVPDFS